MNEYELLHNLASLEEQGARFWRPDWTGRAGGDEGKLTSCSKKHSTSWLVCEAVNMQRILADKDKERKEQDE